MQFDGPLMDAEVPRNLLIESSLNNVSKHFPLTLGERVEASMQRTQPITSRSFTGIAGESAIHSVQQLFFRRALFQEVLGTIAHGLHR